MTDDKNTSDTETGSPEPRTLSEDEITELLANPGDRFMTKREVADFLVVSTATVDNYRRKGRLQRYRLAGGTAIRYLRSDVLRLVSALPSNTRVEPPQLKITRGRRRGTWGQ